MLALAQCVLSLAWPRLEMMADERIFMSRSQRTSTGERRRNGIVLPFRDRDCTPQDGCLARHRYYCHGIASSIDAYTRNLRSLSNFRINQPQDRMPPPIIRAFGILKGAAAAANMHFGLGNLVVPSRFWCATVRPFAYRSSQTDE